MNGLMKVQVEYPLNRLKALFHHRFARQRFHLKILSHYFTIIIIIQNSLQTLLTLCQFTSHFNQGAVIEGVETKILLSFEVMRGTTEKLCTVPQLLPTGALTKECISNQGMTLHGQELKRPFRQQFVVPFNVLATINVCASNWTSEPNSV